MIVKRVAGLALFALLTATPGVAQEPLNRLERVSYARDGSRLVLDLGLSGSSPIASAYFLSAPDRLVVDINDAVVKARLQAKPADPMVSGWSLHQIGLNKARLVVQLNYRPALSELELRDVPGGVKVSFFTTPGRKEKMKLTEGITWVREDSTLDGRWVRLNRVYFDPKDPNVQVIVGLANEKTNARETVSSMVARYDAIAGINGGFFAGSGGPLGLVYRDGRLVTPHVSRRPPRSAFGLTASGKALFGRLAAKGATITDLDGGDWSDAVLALAGGPRLIKDGVARLTTDIEELGPKGNDITRVAARTLVGQAADGQVLFATVSGYRDNHSEGSRFPPVVEWLRSLKIKDAVNLDGGASVDMVVGPHIVSDGPGNRTQEKPVATALLVKDKREKLYPSKVNWELGERVLWADGQSETDLTVRVATPAGSAVPDGTEVRFYTEGITVTPALATTKGGKASVKVRSVRRPGKGVIEIAAGPITERETLMVRVGEPGRILTQLASGVAEKDGSSQKVVAKVQLVDNWGNGVEKEAFTCSVDGSEVVEFTTDHSGTASVELSLPLQGGTFTVTHPRAGKKQVQVPAVKVEPKPAKPSIKE